MEREDLISTYGELLGSGKFKVSPGAVGGVGYDPEEEKERMAFEKRKWEAEMEVRKQETAERRQKEERENEIRRQKAADGVREKKEML